MIPTYKTIAGQIHAPLTYGHGDERIKIDSTCKEEAMEYAQQLEANGFIRLYMRRYPAREKYSNIENIAYAYRGEGKTVTVFFDGTEGITRIVEEDLTPDIPDMSGEGDNEPFVAQLGIRFGASFIIRTRDGSFVIVDGGNSDKSDEEHLLEFLKAHSKKAVPVISLWIFTHADCDHITAATNFMERFGEEVDVKAFSYQFPDPECMDFDKNGGTAKNIRRLERVIKERFPLAALHRMHTGEIYSLAGARIEVLYTPDNLFPYTATSYNDFSAAFTVDFDGGARALFLGDAVRHTSAQIAKLYGEYLKSDIMTVVHHGLIGGNIDLYRCADPEVCLWNTPEKRFTGECETHRFKWCLGEGGCTYNAYLRDERVRARRHYTHGKDAVISAISLEEI